jgi:hypothetical protein
VHICNGLFFLATELLKVVEATTRGRVRFDVGDTVEEAERNGAYIYIYMLSNTKTHTHTHTHANVFCDGFACVKRKERERVVVVFASKEKEEGRRN